MKRESRHQRLVAEINITPFTDVILVLLIIFMMVTPLILQSTIKVQLPKVETSGDLPKTVVITINKRGVAFIEDNQYSLRYDLEILKSKLTSLIQQHHTDSVIINGDKSVEYNFVVKVIDLLSQ